MPSRVQRRRWSVMLLRRPNSEKTQRRMIMESGMPVLSLSDLDDPSLHLDGYWWSCRKSGFLVCAR